MYIALDDTQKSIVYFKTNTLNEKNQCQITECMLNFLLLLFFSSSAAMLNDDGHNFLLLLLLLHLFF